MNLILRGAVIYEHDLHDGMRLRERDVYIQNGRIVPQAPNHAHTVDLSGHTLSPGLMNAHDHLELNHYPRTRFREVYDNAHQWGEDVNARLNDEPFKSLRAYPLKDRLFIGGLKNLLCGATTVAHHGPRYRQMYARDFPVRVLREYGWSHSLHFDSDAAVQRSYRNTPKHWPWFIHLAEGTDEVAAGEYQRLKALGCVGPNTVIVHGVGMTEADIAEAASSVCALVTCPTTNHYLLGKTASCDLWQQHGGRVWVGSDSRLTADGDLLLEPARYSCATKPPVGTRLALSAPFILCDKNAASSNGFNLQRSQLTLVAYAGRPRIGDPDLMAKFPWVQTVAATLDGHEKRIELSLARQIHRCKLKEAGLEVDELPKGRFWLLPRT